MQTQPRAASQATHRTATSCLVLAANTAVLDLAIAQGSPQDRLGQQRRQVGHHLQDLTVQVAATPPAIDQRRFGAASDLVGHQRIKMDCGSGMRAQQQGPVGHQRRRQLGSAQRQGVGAASQAMHRQIDRGFSSDVRVAVTR